MCIRDRFTAYLKSSLPVKADGTKVYSAGDVVAESLTTGTDGQVVLSDLQLGTYVVTEIKSIDGYTINTKMCIRDSKGSAECRLQ